MKIKESKAAAWGALALAVIVIIVTFSLRPVWWAYIDMFFMFMAAFCYLVSVYMLRFNRFAAKRLQMIAFFSGVLMVCSLIGEFVAFQILN